METLDDRNHHRRRDARSACRRALVVLGAATAGIALAACGSGGATAPTATTLPAAKAQALGFKLVQATFSSINSAAIPEGGGNFAPGFQSVTATGAKSEQQVLAFTKEHKVGDTLLSDVKVTQSPGILVVSYRASTTIGGSSSGITQRVNVFVLQGGRWLNQTYADAGVPPGR